MLLEKHEAYSAVTPKGYNDDWPGMTPHGCNTVLEQLLSLLQESNEYFMLELSLLFFFLTQTDLGNGERSPHL